MAVVILTLFGLERASAQTLEPYRLLNRISRQCSAPQIRVGPDGVVHAVWAGYGEDDGYHVWHTMRDADGVWRPEEKLSVGLPGNSYDPSLAIDPRGFPHVVWSSGRGAVEHIYYTRLRGSGAKREWREPFRLDPTDELDCEIPSIRFDSEGRALITWQAGLGAQQQIYGAWAPNRGAFHVSRISRLSQATDCRFPQLTSGPTPMVAWYEADMDGWRVRLARAPLPERPNWELVETGLLNGLPTDRVPGLLSDPKGQLWAVWADARGGAFERLYTAPGNPALGLGAHIGVDELPESNNTAPSVAFGQSERVVVCWVVEKGGRRRIELKQGAGLDRLTAGSVTVSDERDGCVVMPNVALGASATQAHVIWNSHYASGGSGNVYYRPVTLK